MDQEGFQLFTSLRYDKRLVSVHENTQSWPSSSLPASSPCYMLSHHRDRLLDAATNFGWSAAQSAISGPEGFVHLLETLTKTVGTHSSSAGPLRVKVLLSEDGSIAIEANPVPETSKEALFPSRIPPPSSSEPKLKVSPLTGGALDLGPDDSIAGDPPKIDPWPILVDTEATQASGFTSYKTTSRKMYDDARLRVGIQDMAARQEVLLVNSEGEVMEGSLTTPYFWRGGKWVTPKLGSGGQRGTTRRWALGKGLCGEEVVLAAELVHGEECWISNGVKGFLPGKVDLQPSS